MVFSKGSTGLLLLGGMVFVVTFTSFTFSNQVTSARSNAALPRIHPQEKEGWRETSTMDDGNITWIGNTWIPPPGSRLYSAKEMYAFFSKQSVLFVGDSTLRRAYATLYGILNATITHTTTMDIYGDGPPPVIETNVLDDPSVIDINKRQVTERPCWFRNHSLCRPMPGSSGEHRLDYVKAGCVGDMFDFFQGSRFRAIQKDYSILVTSGGTWDTSFNTASTCRRRPAQLDNLMILLQTVQSPSLSVIWRTAGFSNYPRDVERNASLFVLDFNRKAISQIRDFATACLKDTGQESKLTYIDWGKAIFPRSFGQKERLHGDTPMHYGLEARLLFIQMLMNHLMSHSHPARPRNK